MTYDRRDGRDGRDRRDYGGDRGRETKPRVLTVSEPTEIQVQSNLFRYTGQPITFYQYTVTITPEVKRMFMFDKLRRILAHNNALTEVVYAFDGNDTLITKSQIEDVELEYPLREGVMKCKIEFRNAVKSNNGNHTELLNCFNCIIKHYQRENFYVDRKKMILPTTRPIPIGTGLEVLVGLTCNFALTTNGLFLNLDQSFGVFYKPQHLVDLVRDFCANNRRYGTIDAPTQEFFYHFEKQVKKLKVKTTHRGEKNKKFIVSGLVNETARDKMVKFTNRDNSTEEEMSVADYFRKQYFELKHPNLPLVEIKIKNQPLYFPMEVLEIVPMQKYMPKLNEVMTASMIKIAAKRPDDRFAQIRNKAEELQVFKNTTLDAFGIVFDNAFTNTKGTILPPPVIEYANSSVEVRGGSWNLRDVSALKPAKVDSWKIFYFASRNKVRTDIIDKFTDMSRKYGIDFPREMPVQEQLTTVEQFYAAKKEHFNLIVLPDKSSLRYEDIKRVAETYTGHVTQCVLGSNASTKMGSPAFIGNILLKINAKLGGENHTLKKKLFANKSTILIGLNVQHPGVTDVDSPTVVAAVGSLDYDFVNYKTVIKTQERKTEIVTEMKEIITTLLRAHFAETSQKPERIILFREGIGESVFDAIFTQEISALKEACAAMEKNYHPEINFIVAQKRHSVRFSKADDMLNLAPGSCVSGLSSGDMIDFFLVSAHALQGTARPTRYKMLLNESGFTMESLYTDLFSMCHLYARATKSVSVVPPIYYANLAATRGKAYFEKNEQDVVEMRQVIRKISDNLFYV